MCAGRMPNVPADPKVVQAEEELAKAYKHLSEIKRAGITPNASDNVNSTTGTGNIAGANQVVHAEAKVMAAELALE